MLTNLFSRCCLKTKGFFSLAQKVEIGVLQIHYQLSTKTPNSRIIWFISNFLQKLRKPNCFTFKKVSQIISHKAAWKPGIQIWRQISPSTAGVRPELRGERSKRLAIHVVPKTNEFLFSPTFATTRRFIFYHSTEDRWPGLQRSSIKTFPVKKSELKSESIQWLTSQSINFSRKIKPPTKWIQSRGKLVPCHLRIYFRFFDGKSLISKQDWNNF